MKYQMIKIITQDESIEVFREFGSITINQASKMISEMELLKLELLNLINETKEYEIGIKK